MPQPGVVYAPPVAGAASGSPAYPVLQPPPMPVVPIPAVPPNPPKAPLSTTPQALQSTYASRMKTGASLLVQPIFNNNTTSLLGGVTRSSRRGAVINYADPGSGDDLPDAGELDSDDSDFAASGGTRAAVRGQQQQAQQQFHAAPAPSHGLALPAGAYQQPATANLALPGPSPLSNSYTAPQQPKPTAAVNAVAGPSTPPASTPVPSTPVPLTLEQQHITAVEGIVPTLQNIVATVNLDCRLDLKTIALHARNAEYNPKRFAAVIMRIREPKTTALIFASGKMVVTGAKSEDDSRLASRKYARIVQKLGFDAKFSEFKIQNIVGSCDVKFPIRLEGLAYSHGQFSSYEPELFPGLIYRMLKPKVVLLIFVSGKIVLTGAKVREEIYTAFNTIYTVLCEFRKP
ncbi:hypothetical protein H1R20_g14637, partial [Candolleomyces eurysporus]